MMLSIGKGRKKCNLVTLKAIQITHSGILVTNCEGLGFESMIYYGRRFPMLGNYHFCRTFLESVKVHSSCVKGRLPLLTMECL